MPKIFISYSSKDRALVDELAGDLDVLFDGDIEIWYDRELNRSGGHQWWSLICEAIRQCDIFIYALSTHVLASEPCKREYGYARQLGKPVLPVAIDELEYRFLPVELQAAQIVNFRQRSRDQQKSLRASVRSLPPAPDLPPNAKEIEPAAPLDPAGVLFDRITRLSADPDQQKYLIVDIEDLQEDRTYAHLVPQLLERLLQRDEVLTVRNLKRAQELLGKVTPPPPQPARPRVLDILPTPFAWIDIPKGAVTLVENYDDKTYFGSKGEGKRFEVAAFQIAKYPVTNAQFRKFIDAGGYSNQTWWTADGWQARLDGIAYVDNTWKPTGKAWIEPRYWQDDKWNKADYPVVGVSWFEAIAFCNWLNDATGENVILPTEQQWQRAAQGDDGRAYPYGEEFDKERCNFNTSGTTPVRQYQGKGDSPFGVVDMSGNVWEWCLTDYDNGSQDVSRTSERRVLRGGSWRLIDTVGLRADFRVRDTPAGGYYVRGFRLALS